MRPMTRARSGGGTLLMVVLMAVMTLAMVGFFQFFAEQVTRTQGQVRQASYLRYLTDSALTEATVTILEQLNSGDADVAKFQALIGTTVDVPLTIELGEVILGAAPSIEVKVLKDRDRDPDKEGIWGTDATTKQYGNLAFPGEDAGLLVLVATIEIVDPAGSKLIGAKLKGSASRAFAYRLVSPAPPKGLNKVTFVAHKWEYFKKRLLGAHQEIFDILGATASQKVFGEHLIKERFAAIEASAGSSRAVANLSLVLLKTAGLVGGSGASGDIADALVSAVQAQCDPSCREAIPTMRSDDPKVIADCLLLMNETYIPTQQAIMALANPNGAPKLKAEGEPERELEPDERLNGYYIRPGTTDPTDFRPGINQMVASLQTDGTSPGYTTVQEAWDDLVTGNGSQRGRLVRCPESFPIDRTQGLYLGMCSKDGDQPRWYTEPHKNMRDQVIEEAVRRNAKSPAHWENTIQKVFKQGLVQNIRKSQQGDKSAKENYSMENLLLFSQFKQDFLDTEKQATRDALESLEVKDGSSLTGLQYQGMSKLDGPVDALDQALKDVTPPPDSNQELKITELVSQLASTLSALKEAYLADKDSWTIQEGPLFIDSTQPVTSEQLEYTYPASPTRTDMVELFPLPQVPYVDPNKISPDQRGFLVPHANWARPFGKRDAGGEKWDAAYEKTLEKAIDSCGKGELLECLKETEGVAHDLAHAYGFTKDWKNNLGMDKEVLDLLTQWSEDNPDFPIFDMNKMNPLNPEPPLSDNPMGGGKGKDSEAMVAYAAKWNDLVKKFTDAIAETHKRHADLGFKVWPLEVPPEAPPETAGWDGSEPQEISDYRVDPSSPMDKLQPVIASNQGTRSKGGLYIESILHPDLNRQRAAFRFADIGEFNRFLVESCGHVQGTYFVAGQGDETEWKIAELRDKMAARCPDRGIEKDGPLLQGFGYIAFPNRLVLNGDLEIEGFAGASGNEEASLVLVAQGVTMKSQGSSSKVRGVVLSNGQFFVEDGKSASISGALVTTGTQVQGDQELPAHDPDNPMKVDDYSATKVGKLADLTIEPDDALRNAPEREKFMRILFSPFRVADDFEVRRQ